MKRKHKKRVAIIGTVGLPAKYGGFETLAAHLAAHLGDEYRLRVYCSGQQYGKAERRSHYKKAHLTYLPFSANGVQSIVYDSLSILHALFVADVLLILGVSGAWLLPFVRLFTNKKIIVSIDGIEWKRAKWGLLAKWYLFWAEGLAVKYSHIDISDNEAIQDYTAARYGTLSRIVEYGADHTLKVQADKLDLDRYALRGQAYAFKVCRIEPENQVHLVLEAFRRQRRFPLVVVGNWSKSAYGQQLRAQYADCRNIHLLDPIYDQEALDRLRGNAAIYIHGHSAGGTNPSLVEAMYLGLPVVAFDVSYNRSTTEGKAMYFRTAVELERLLKHSYTVKLKAIGQQMQEIANRRYTWPRIAAKYRLLIEEAICADAKSEVLPEVSRLPYSTLLKLGKAHLKTADQF